MASPERYGKVKKMLEKAGYRLDRISSSHHIFVKPGEPEHISVPVKDGKVKPYYVKQIQKICGG